MEVIFDEVHMAVSIHHLGGMLQALGVVMNAQLRQSLSNPWLASAVSFGPIFAFFLCAFAVLPKPFPALKV